MRDAVSPAYYIVYLCKFILYVAEHTIRVALTQLAPSAFYVKFCHRQFGIGTRPCSTTYYVCDLQMQFAEFAADPVPTKWRERAMQLLGAINSARSLLNRSDFRRRRRRLRTKQNCITRK